MFKTAKIESIANVPKDPNETNGRPKLSRRTFLGATAAAVTGIALDNALGGRSASAEQEKPLNYGIFFGAVEPIIITPDHPKYSEAYKSYAAELKEIQQRASSIFGLVTDVVSYTYDHYYKASLENSHDNTISLDSNEAMERLEAGIGTCGDIALLCQFGFHSLGIQTQFYVLDFIATNNGNHEYIAHANLEARVARPGEEAKDYVLEPTNGTIMERDNYYDYLKTYFEIHCGIVTKNPVDTGLQ